jgi:hypothetical protein
VKKYSDRYRYTRIIHFGSGDAYGLLALNSKLAVRLHFTFEFIGNYTKEELKKKYPQTSIRPHTYNGISKSEKEALKEVYRKEKIKKLLSSV